MSLTLQQLKEDVLKLRYNSESQRIVQLESFCSQRTSLGLLIYGQIELDVVNIDIRTVKENN